ncbi:hypothetical protein [Nocardioides sp. Soil805]|uniref:hypothetical protein n=1 Tax=Nocardioides sp. Soil805 TaxID=1736416 RepID=UPI0012E39D57|nr:hypothetical protein [Nocardioides sp. Soil805]
MKIFSTVLTRLAVMGAGLATYYGAVSLVTSDDGGGADIGAGLLAFSGLMLASFVWAFLDGRSNDLAATTVVWSLVAVALAAGWRVVVAVASADTSMSFAERLSADALSTLFTFGLVLVPAVLGAVVGGASRSGQAVRR